MTSPVVTQALAPKHCKHKFARVRGDRHWESPSFSPSLRHQLLQRGLITGYSVWELNTIIWKPCANCKRIRVSLNGVFRLSQRCLKSVLKVSQEWIKGVSRMIQGCSITQEGCFKLNATEHLEVVLDFWRIPNAGTFDIAITWQAESSFEFLEWKWMHFNK